jgi:hypothetical protein
MSLLLRIDVDKPFGNHSLIRRLLSKLIEDYFPLLRINFGYLSHLKEFIKYCNDNSIIGTFYFRICTRPDLECLDLIRLGEHEIGLHLENSSSKTAFLEELELLKSYLSVPIKSFSKHGSGVYKLGKYHFPKYEPIKYLKWSKESDIDYYSGNGIPNNPNELISRNNYHECVFWLEPNYRSPTFKSLEDLINFAKYNNVVILIHPCNYLSDIETKKAFQQLVKLAYDNKVDWKLLNKTS